jgi:hypothetical protein
MCLSVSQLITVDSTTPQALATCKRVKPRLSRRSRSFCPSVIIHSVNVFQLTIGIQLTIDSRYYSVSIGAKSHTARSQSSACLGRGLALTPTSHGDKLIMPYKERLLPWEKSALASPHAAIDCWSIPNSRITKRTSKADRLS